jgi:hypothetical protein
VLISSLFVFSHLQGEFIDYLLATDSVQSAATLIEKREHGVFEYQYQANGKVFTGTDQPNREFRGAAQYDGLQVGSQAPVNYVRSWPAISTLQYPVHYGPQRILLTLVILGAWVWIVKLALTDRALPSQTSPAATGLN